ncbi:MAG: type VI secretion system tip protein VgrG [Candidatus Acidiferrum sp.]
MAYTQDDRIIAIDTPLGKDVFLLQGFAAQEAVSRLFRVSAELWSENSSIDFNKIIGQQVTVSLKLADGSKRYFNGHVSRFAQSGVDQRFTHYHAEIVPWLWFLTRRADCRIFQNMTIPDIVAKVFKDRGFGDFRNSLQGDFEQREYCVQYRETDFSFVSRLMEQYGIFYFFEHEQNKHTLVMGNKPSVHKACPVQSKARVDFTGGAYLKDEDLVGSWNLEQELRPGKYAMTDYNFETPSTSLLANEDTIFKVGGNDKYEVFDYPGEYTKKAEGESRTQIRMQEEETIHLIGVGSGTCRTFATGYRFDLSGHSRSDQNQTYLLTEIQHSATVGGSYSGVGADSDEHYSNHFKCIPYSVPFRPQRHTPRPFVQGPQTAVVTGKSGEEIWTDKYGRVKVHFFWDREGSKDEKSSCWVRVSQPWAGKNWGAINIPRMGQEVIVEFLEGDPDRPLITGRVYNDEQMPPYKLADNQTRTTFLTRSTKGGGSSNFNELRFEDKKSSEQIFMNAEKDMDLRVENESREFVGASRHLIVKGDQKEKVEGDKNGNFAKNLNEKIGQNMSLDIGQSLNEKTGMKFAHDAGQEIHLKAGMNVVIEAGLELTIKASGGFINIGPAGIAISGTPLVLINSGGAPGVGSGSSPTSPADPDTADDGSKGGKM